LRPDVVLFGESLRLDQLDQLENTLAAGVDLVFSVGTSSLFPYIAAPIKWASENGVATVEINPGRSTISHLADFRVKLGAADAFGQLATVLSGQLGGESER
jgi:NAD-dependent deacetylase